MGRKKRIGELPSGNVRRQVFIGYVDIVDENGKPVIGADGKQKRKRVYESVTASSAAEADRLAAELKSGKKDTRDKQITIGKAVDDYIRLLEPVRSPSTIRGYKSTRKRLAPIDNIRLKDFTDMDAQAFISELTKDCSPKYVRNINALLTSSLSLYHYSVSVQLPKKVKKEAVIPIDEQVTTLVKLFKDRGDTDMLNAVYLAAFATLRRSEIGGLTADDVRGNILHVHAAKVLNSDNIFVEKPTTKTDLSDRYIELPQFVVDSLPKEGALVNISPSNVTARFRRARNKLGFDKVTLQTLRRYSASIMHAIGVPDTYIMGRGGWKTDNVMKEIYRRSMSDFEKTFTARTNTYFEHLQHECNTDN